MEDMVSRDHAQGADTALEEAVARLRKDVVTGFASEYCVASRPALEIVLDALQRDDQDPLIWKLEVIQRSIEGDIKFAQDSDRNQPMTDDTFIIPRHWMPHAVAKNWIGVLSEAIGRLKDPTSSAKPLERDSSRDTL